jgi:glutamate-5-semialdehyde dehydrogenase
MSSLRKSALAAKKAFPALALLSTEKKNKALIAMARALKAHRARILEANAADVVAAKKKGLSAALTARLTLDKSKINQMASSIAAIAKLPDPVGRVLSEKKRPNGLSITKISVPLGVILIIYESRPNVTADCMALCLKSGNSVILKGGSEALHSNRAIYGVLDRAAVGSGIPAGACQLVPVSGREAVRELLTMSDVIDLVIPRGGEGLIRQVAELSKIPVIKHFKGVCHVFVDRAADLGKAERIVLNAKAQNPSVCNALECLLVDEAVAKKFLPKVVQALEKSHVEVRGCPETRKIVPRVKKAVQKDWGTEYLDLIIAVRVVKDVNEAITHVETYGSHHSDAIVTENFKTADIFTHAVDSAAVFVNSSTRFNDGGEFGLGAEMGISTDKLHVRGPMGLEGLTSYKYVVRGNGQVRG